MDSLTPGPGDEGGAEVQNGFGSSEIGGNRVEVKNHDAAHDSGAGGLNPLKKLGVMSATLVSTEDGAGFTKVVVSKASMPPPSMPPPSLSSASMPPPSMPPSAMPPPSMPPPSMPPPSMPPSSMPPPSMPPPSMPAPSMPPPSMPPSKITKANLPGPMGPPPLRVKQSKEVQEPVQSAAAEASTKSSSDVKNVGGEGNSTVMAVQASKIKVASDPASSGIPYVKPAWSAQPGIPFKLETLKEGVIVNTLDVSSKGAYMFGRSDRCDFMLEHPTVSRYHAVLQYNDKGEAFIYDLGSTHGTYVNKRQVKAKDYTPVYVGSILRFGLSTRLYVLQGPSELMPEEGPSLKDRVISGGALGAAEAAHMRDMSLRRAKAEAAALEGASWGMQEDAEPEEEEEDLDEVTWQTYKGPLTDKQQKTLEKVHKRHEKMANLNKEIDAIRAKEGSQGGLTQGQQTQIARNEQRIEVLLEELESMEETVNESIRESLGARTGKSMSKKKPVFEDEDEDDSDDEFYDRTNKRKQKAKEGEGVQVVETAETLMEKRDVIAKEMDVVLAELKAEEAKSITTEESSSTSESIDPLDAFMSSVSTNIVKDKASRLSKELSKLQAEADRIARLLRIADPSGEAARKWAGKAEDSSQSRKVETIVENRLRLRASKEAARELASQAKEALDSGSEVIAAPPTVDVNMDPVDEKVEEAKEMPTLAPTLRLGAPQREASQSEATTTSTSIEQNTETGNEFVGYKDRKRPVSKEDLIQVEEATGENGGSKDRDVASSAAMEAIALLMRHKTGLTAQEELQEESRTNNSRQHPAGTKTRGKKKRKLGPERPPTMVKEADELEEAWVPPQGQTGDGRIALNDKLGY